MSKLEYMKSLILELCKLPNEVEWVEFKHNNADPKEIGSYLSALANAALSMASPLPICFGALRIEAIGL